MKRNIYLFYLSRFFTASLFFLPIWVTFQSRFLDEKQMAFFASLILITTIILELPTGVFADLIGKRLTVLLGFLFQGLGYVVLGLFPSLASMVIYSILFGIGTALQSGADRALIFDTLVDLNREDDYPEISSKASFIFQMTGTMCILLGGYLFQISFKLPYVLSGLFLLIGSVVVFLMKEPKTDSQQFSLSSYIEQTKIGARESFRTLYLRKLSLMYIVLSALAISGHRFFAQPFMAEIGFSEIQRSWVASIIKFLVGLLTLYLGKKKKLFASKYFLLFLPIIMILSYIPVSFSYMPFMFLFLFGIALPSGAIHIFIGYFLNLKIRSRYRATAISTLNLVISILWAISNYIGGLVWSSYSVGVYYFWIGIIVLLFILPLTLNIIWSHNGEED